MTNDQLVLLLRMIAEMAYSSAAQLDDRERYDPLVLRALGEIAGTASLATERYGVREAANDRR